MKKLNLFLITVVIAISATTFAHATTQNNVITVLSNIGNINKLEAHGNVEVLISTGEKDEAVVSNNYYAENAFIQNVNGVLRISSYKGEKLVVYVTVNDLRSITAYDNAVVKSEGRLSAIALDVNLYDSAYAGLNLDNYATTINVSNQAKADLSGNVVDYDVTYGNSSTINRTNLVAVNATENKIAPVFVQKVSASADELIGL